jgi:beta-glucosidase
LSYTKFDYSDARLNAAGMTAGETAKVSFTVKNSGERDGDEVAQVYFRHVNSALPQPKLALCGFVRIPLRAGQAAHIVLDLPAERFRYWDPAKKQYAVEPGDYEILLGAASDDLRARLPLKISP